MSKELQDIFDRLDKLLDMMGEELDKEYPDIERIRNIHKLICINGQPDSEDD